MIVLGRLTTSRFPLGDRKAERKEKRNYESGCMGNFWRNQSKGEKSGARAGAHRSLIGGKSGAASFRRGGHSDHALRVFFLVRGGMGAQVWKAELGGDGKAAD